MDLFLIGGHQGRPATSLDRAHEPLYDEAVLAVLDTETLHLRRLLGHRSPPSICPTSVGHAFKGISLDGRQLLLCTERELVWVDPDGTVTDSWSHPWMNDVHHAVRWDGVLHVVSTGLDAVLVGDDVHAMRHVPVVPEARPPTGDVRCANLRPHRSHPNHLFLHDGRRWVTRLHQRDALCLDDGRRLRVDLERVHDGEPGPGGPWLTTVDGRLVLPGPDGPRRAVDLNALEGRDEPLGWCRGLAFVGGIAWVGFSRLRVTRARQHLAWLRGRLRGEQRASRLPTRVVGYDLDEGRVVAEVDLHDVGIDALFGMLPAPG